MNLLAELDNTDRRTRALLDDLTEEQLEVPYDQGINPPVWEVGHAAFFYEYFLLRELGDAAPRMPGYDEIWDSFEIAHRKRWQEGVVPDKATTLEYYARVLDEVRERLAKDPDARERHLCEYAIGHQNMHIESLIWCRQTIGYPAPSSATAPQPGSDTSGDIEIEGGDYPVGMTEGFSFDNERPGHTERVEPFRISRTLVTNGEFVEFIRDGGYLDGKLWSFRGRDWLENSGAKQPVYWRDGWQMRHFDQWIDLPLETPVMHVNYWEAEAYCKWAGRRLPTEFEWEAAARGREGKLFPWGNEMDPARADMDGTCLGLSPATAYPADGCLQLIGTAWEWTSSQFLPYDGFAVDMYPYMSTLQFGTHKVTKGGSCATSSCLIRNSYRQAYFPDRRDAFTSFRTCAL
ncbi:MAG: selenoneine synthase SenA [Planctomycetota bacterium]|jgi:iron(II)-dependent oxidoreductase